jgi:two-component sensor histidine kinase
MYLLRLDHRPKASAFGRVVAVVAGCFILLGGLPASAAEALTNAVVTTNPPPAESLDSLHQRGSSDFSDMGDWIWDSTTFDRQTVRFWKAFQIPTHTLVNRARLRITGDNEYTLYLDGHELGRDAEWRHLYEYDITPFLTAGKHTLAVEVYNSSREAGMVLGLRVGLADGNTVAVKSDASWRLVPNDLYGWEKKLEPTETWPKATVLVPFGAAPWGKFEVINLVPPLRPLLIPFWQTGWFQLTLATLCGGVMLVCFWLLSQLLMHKHEKELLLRERSRIARDIHDDLGLHMTQLVLQGEVAQSELPVGSETRAQFDKICEEGREALRAMDEVLWAINPRRDTLREFTTYVCSYAQKVLQPSAIQCVLDVDVEIPATAFDLPLRRNLLLAVKEALNNAVKYSQATELLLKIRLQDQSLILVLADNGRGFDPAMAKAERNGLTNLPQRMREVGGDFQLTSQPGQGCQVVFITPLVQPQPRFSWLSRRWFTRLSMKTFIF